MEGAPITLLKMGKQTFLDVYTTDNSCSNQVLQLPFSQRKCILATDEISSTGIKSEYRQPACIVNCFRDIIHNICGCHPFVIPLMSFDNIRECGVLDIACFVKNYRKFVN